MDSSYGHGCFSFQEGRHLTLRNFRLRVFEFLWKATVLIVVPFVLSKQQYNFPSFSVVVSGPNSTISKQYKIYPPYTLSCYTVPPSSYPILRREILPSHPSHRRTLSPNPSTYSPAIAVARVSSDINHQDCNTGRSSCWWSLEAKKTLILREQFVCRPTSPCPTPLL